MSAIGSVVWNARNAKSAISIGAAGLRWKGATVREATVARVVAAVVAIVVPVAEAEIVARAAVEVVVTGIVKMLETAATTVATMIEKIVLRRVLAEPSTTTNKSLHYQNWI